MKPLIPSVALAALLSAGAATAEVSSQTDSRVELLLDRYGFENVELGDLSDSQKIAVTTADTGSDQTDLDVRNQIGSIVYADAPEARVSVQTDRMVADLIERYGVTDVDAGSLDAGQKVAITLVDQNDRSVEVIAEEIRQIAAEPTNRVALQTAEKARDLLDEYGFGNVDVRDLTAGQVVAITLVDDSAERTALDVRTEIGSIVYN